MRLALCPYSNKEIDEYARALIGRMKNQLPPSDFAIALPAIFALASWRATFDFPLRGVTRFLRHHAKMEDSDALVSSRMKRLESIVLKLKRNPTMEATRMQDIGGCRAVLSSMKEVNALVEYFRTKIEPHLKGARKYDYISEPKDDGYRSVHLVVRYQPRVPSPFRNLITELPSRRIEIQLRSDLQHQWATAVETVDLFTQQTLKLGSGDARWRRFFALASGIFALQENCAPVPGTPDNDTELIEEIRPLWHELNVFSLLSEWANAMVATEINPAQPSAFYLIETNIEAMETSITGFPIEHAEKAQESYRHAEELKLSNPHLNAVLVSVDSLSKLREAFPNYYGDTYRFLIQLKTAIDDKGDL